MVETVGKKLSQARQKRGLTIDEAAHATKLRPDKIVALENDDYSCFANNIYAKGFLQIYARYLKVDVSDFARTLDNSNPISVNDYQYLSNAPAPRKESNNSSYASASSIRDDRRRPPSLAPLFAFVLIAILGGIGWWVKENYARILDASTPASQRTTDTPASDSTTPAETTPSTTAPAVATPAPATASKPPETVPPGPVGSSPATPSPVAPVIPTAPAVPRISDQDFIAPIPVATTDAAHPGPANSSNEILVATVKKTWVTVRKDDPKAPPIFEDYIYPSPSSGPLKLHGGRFFIEAKDPTAVQITKNGLPIAYQPVGVPVQ